MVSRRSLILAAAAACVPLMTLSTASANPWTFGVISDTQDTVGTGSNTVATNIISAVNQQFVAQGVKFVVQPGDLADSESDAALQTRLNANSALTAAGIPFYGLRGNHDDTSGGMTFFQSHYIPGNSPGVAVNVAPDGISYSVTYNNTKLVLLDILTADSTSAMDSATTWMGGQLSLADHNQAFVFQHKDLLGQNHKDNAFGSSNDANPTQQNNFFAALAQNGVRYDICGHDHMHHRSLVTSPDGLNKVQEIISQSDSTKYYTASSGFSSREQSIADQQNMIGYYTYTVDGPRVIGRYYTTPIGANSDVMPNPVWTLQESFGYSINGKEFTVARGASYATGATNVKTGATNQQVADAIASGGGFAGTSMAILNGTNSNTGTAEGSRAEIDDLNTGWSPRSGAPTAAKSDVLTLWGMANALGSAQTDTFVLSMSYDPTYTPGNGDRFFGLQRLDASGVLHMAGTNFVGNLPYSAGTDVLGDYGFDASTHTAWAVVNQAGDFAVAAVPEPASLSVLGFGALGLLARRRRR